MTAQAARGMLLAPPGLFTRLRVHLARRQAKRQLQELDDRLLRDIGVTPGEIDIRRFLK